MRHNALLALFALAITPLTACSAILGVDGFTDEAAKERVWEVYKCNIFANSNAEAVKLELTADAYSGDLSRNDEIEAMQTIIQLSDAEVVGEVMSFEDRDGMHHVCSGWLWEHHKATDPNYRTGFEEFTVEDAKEAGVFDEE